MRFPKLARRGWLLAVEIVLLGVGIAAAFLSLSAARAGLSTAFRVPHPNRTYFVGRAGGQIPPAAYSDLASWRERRDVFSHFGAFSVWGPVVITTQSQTINVDAASVAKGIASFLPGRMELGRPLIDSDFFSGSQNVLVSAGLVRRLGLVSAVGSVIQTNWGMLRIVGVLPESWRFPYPVQPSIMMPTVPKPLDASIYTVLGELRSGLTQEQAEREMNSVLQHSVARANGPVRLVSMKASLDPASVRISEYGLVLGLLTLFLLIATASLIELLDAIRGKKERAIKLALGATRARLVLERVLEVLVICILSVAAGCLLVVVSQPWLALTWATNWVTVPRLDGFTLASLGALLLFVFLAVSIAPVLMARATQAYAALKEERASTSRTVQRSRTAVVALQVAVSIAFAFGAARLAGGLHALATEPIGMEVANIWVGAVDLPTIDKRQSPSANKEQVRSLKAQAAAKVERLRLELRSLPGVAEVGFSSEAPVVASHFIITSEIAARGAIPSPTNAAYNIPVTFIDPHYLQLLGSRLLAGRYFTAADSSRPFGDGNPAILSQPLARKLFGQTDPVGKEIVWLAGATDGSEPFSKVVGMVGGMRTLGLAAPTTSQLFLPQAGLPSNLALRTKGAVAISFVEVQQAISDVFPGSRLEGFGPLRERFESELSVPRKRLGLLAFFAAVSAAVSAFGLISVLLAIIKERDLEIGIRRALGASDRDLATALLKHVLPWIGLGLTAGLAFPILYPVPLGVGVASGAPDAKWAGASAVFAMLVLIAVSLWLPLRRAFRRPINDLLKVE